MSLSPGIDLNGVCDCTVLPDGALRLAAAPPVVIDASPLGVLTGRMALDAPAGRSGWPAEDGIRLPVLSLLRALGHDDDAPLDAHEVDAPEAARLLGRHLAGLLPARVRTAVAAVPDTDGFDERTRARLLDGAARAGIDLSLLWRPVAALLGWGEALDARALQALHGRSACVMQLLADGIALGSYGLEAVEQGGRLTLVPVRRRDGLRSWQPWPHGNLSRLLARELDCAEPALCSGPWAWNVLLGRAGQRELQPDAQAPGGWRLLQGPAHLGGALADALRRGLDAVLASTPAALQDAALILIEGPLNDAALATDGAAPLAFGHYVQKRLTSALGSSTSRRIVTAGLRDALVARGCSVSATRLGAREIAYYDFLPMLEINVLRAGEHAFAELIEPAERVAGGSSYTHTLADRFIVAKDTRSLVFYLLKEDEAGARRSETLLPVPPSTTVEISLQVTQTPAQGYARVEIRPTKSGILGQSAILLDWTTMTAITGSREDVLLELELQGLGHPDIAPQRTHRLLWKYKRGDGLTILKALTEFTASPLKTTAHSQYKKLLVQTRSLVGLRTSPYLLTQGTSPDRTACTAFDSDGNIPEEFALQMQPCIEQFRNCLNSDFSAVKHARTRQDIQTRRNLSRLGATLYAACPDEIVHYYRLIARGTVSDPTLVLHAGKVLCTEADLDSLFRYCADCSISAVKDGKKLSNFVLRAAGDALAYRETAGVVLNAISADRLADAALMVLEEEINAINYKVRFRAAARLALFILRHRMRRRDFLHPSSRDPANRRRAQRLEDLITRSLASRHAGDDLTVALQELQAQIRYRGTNAIIDIDADAGDETEDED